MKSYEISEQLYNAISSITREEEKILIIHSSLSRLGFDKNQEFLTGVLDAIERILADNKTILFPSFNFSFPKKKDFDINRDLSETGVLANLARDHLNFKRTHNPMFSFSIKGPYEEALFSFRKDSGYGQNTLVNRLSSKDVNVIMLGAGWECTTVLHAVEEELLVPYREHIKFTYPVNFGNGIEIFPYELFARKQDPPTKLRFDKIRDALLIEKELRSFKLSNNTVIEAANALSISDIGKRNIIKDPFYFVDKIL